MMPKKIMAYVFWLFISWFVIQDFRSQNHRKWTILRGKKNKVKREFRRRFYKEKKLTRHPNDFHCNHWRKYWMHSKEAVLKKKDSKEDGIPFLNKTTDFDRGRPTSLNKKSKKILPIGALTTKPFAFKARSWDVNSIYTQDVLEPLGSFITVQVSSLEIKRILPRINEELNDFWISNNSRFFFDSMKRWRLLDPMIRLENSKRFMSVTWENCYYTMEKHFVKAKNNFFIINSKFSDLKTIWLTKKVLNAQGKNFFNTQFFCNDDLNNNVLPLKDIISFDELTTVVFIGNHVRLENPVLNLRFRKLSKLSNFNFFTIGSYYSFLIDQKHISLNSNQFFSLLEGTHDLSTIFSTNNKINKLSCNNIIILGSDFLKYDFNDICNFSSNKIIIKSILPDLGLNGISLLNYKNSVSKTNNNSLEGVSLFFNNTYMKTMKNHYNIYVGHNVSRMFTKKFDMLLATPGIYEFEQSFLNTVGDIFNIRPFLQLPNKAKSEEHIFQIIMVILHFNEIKFSENEEFGSSFKYSPVKNLKFKFFLNKSKLKIKAYKRYLSNQNNNFYCKDVMNLSSTYLREAAILEKNGLKNNFYAKI